MEINNNVREELQKILGKDDEGVSETPQPAKEDVREFQRLLEVDSTQQARGVEPVNNSNAVQNIDEVRQAEEVARIRQAESIDMYKGLMPREEALNDAVRLVEEIATGSISPEELYRLQYVMKVLHIKTISATQTSQQVEQGMDTALKQ